MKRAKKPKNRQPVLVDTIMLADMRQAPYSLSDVSWLHYPANEKWAKGICGKENIQRVRVRITPVAGRGKR